MKSAQRKREIFELDFAAKQRSAGQTLPVLDVNENFKGLLCSGLQNNPKLTDGVNFHSTTNGLFNRSHSSLRLSNRAQTAVVTFASVNKSAPNPSKSILPHKNVRRNSGSNYRNLEETRSPPGFSDSPRKHFANAFNKSIAFNHASTQAGLHTENIEGDEAVGSHLNDFLKLELPPPRSAWTRDMSALLASRDGFGGTEYNRYSMTLPPTGTLKRKSKLTRRTARNPIPHSLQSLPDINTSHEGLKKELMKSLLQMQKHTDRVKENVLHVKEIAAIQGNKRARAFMFSLAAEKMQDALSIIVTIILSRGWTTWSKLVMQERNRERLQAEIRSQKLRLIFRILRSAVVRYLQGIILKWIKFVESERMRLFKIKCVQAAVVIQKWIRGTLARIKYASWRDQKKYAWLYRATIRVQAFIRGTAQRKRYLLQVRKMRENHSVRLIQRVERGRRARKRVRLARRRRNKNLAATAIQCLYRCRAALSVAKKIRERRKRDKATVYIQSYARRYLAGLKVERLRRDLEERYAAVTIQAAIRGALCRSNMNRIRSEIAEYRYQRSAAALKIQATFRGHHGRVLTRLRLQEFRKKMKKRHDAATKIQCLVRRRQASSLVQRLRVEQYQKWLEDARQWNELWSEQANNWYYLERSTNLPLWQPPSTGYTKADGRLVLKNGDIVDDPLLAAKLDADLLLRCSECQDRKATRHCDQCSDLYCTKCYKSCHSTGTRKKHTWTATGYLDCTECELEAAERWCITCDEPFCDTCWRKVHSKGKRKFHPFSNVDPEGHVDSRIFTIDGEEVTHYDVAYSQQRHELEQHQHSVALMHADTGNWTAVTDGSDAYSQSQSYTLPSGGGVEGQDWAVYDPGASNALYQDAMGFHPDVAFADSGADVYAASGGQTAGDLGHQGGHVYYHNPNETDGSEWSQAYDENNYPYWYNSVIGHSQYENPFEQP